jgi:excisionase family DNA binding protein
MRPAKPTPSGSDCSQSHVALDEPDRGLVSQQYLTTPEAARYLNVSTQFLEIARYRGVGPPYCKIGRAVRYRRSRLDEWMISNERRPT